jgi:hypothetical protein
MSTPEPDPPMDPVEALKHIRALIEGSCETTYGTPAEPIIQMITSILDKALPTKRRRRVTKP